MRRLALLAAVALLLGPRVAATQLTVMSSGAFSAALRELAVQYERTTHTSVVIGTTTIGTGASSIPNRLARGETADVVIAAQANLDDLVARRLVSAGSVVPLARSSIGVAVRHGAPKPDISTVEAFRQALLQARSIAYSASVSGTYLSTELLQRLAIADQVLPRSRRIENEPVGEVVARGDAELGIQQISELRPVSGIDVVGALPADIQRVTMFSGGVATHSANADDARALIRFLASAEAAPAIARTGLEPVASPRE